MLSYFETKNQDLNKMKADHEKELKNLYAEVGKLSTELSWIKKIWHLPRLDRNV